MVFVADQRAILTSRREKCTGNFVDLGDQLEMQYSKWLGRAITVFVGATTIVACSEEDAEFDLGAIDESVDAGTTGTDDLARVYQPDGGALIDSGMQALDPGYAKVYELITTHCASCHTEGKPLNLSSPELAHRELVGVEAKYKSCASDGGVAHVRVIANAPQESLLMAKLENRQTCGKQMPTTALLPASDVEVFRSWIANGAKLH
jgi:hypothetical protein